MVTGAPCCRVCPTPPERALGMVQPGPLEHRSAPQCSRGLGGPFFPTLIVTQIKIRIVFALLRTHQQYTIRRRFKLRVCRLRPRIRPTRRHRRRDKQHRALQRRCLPRPCRQPRLPRLLRSAPRRRVRRHCPMRKQCRRQHQRQQTRRRPLLPRCALQIRSRCQGCKTIYPAIVCAWRGTLDRLEQVGRALPVPQVSSRHQKAPRPA